MAVLASASSSWSSSSWWVRKVLTNNILHVQVMSNQFHSIQGRKRSRVVVEVLWSHPVTPSDSADTMPQEGEEAEEEESKRQEVSYVTAILKVCTHQSCSYMHWCSRPECPRSVCGAGGTCTRRTAEDTGCSWGKLTSVSCNAIKTVTIFFVFLVFWQHKTRNASVVRKK